MRNLPTLTFFAHTQAHMHAHTQTHTQAGTQTQYAQS